MTVSLDGPSLINFHELQPKLYRLIIIWIRLFGYESLQRQFQLSTKKFTFHNLPYHNLLYSIGIGTVYVVCASLYNAGMTT